MGEKLERYFRPNGPVECSRLFLLLEYLMMLIKNTFCAMFVNSSRNIYPWSKKLFVCLEEGFRATEIILVTSVVILSCRNQNTICYIVLNLINFGKHYGTNWCVACA